MLSFLEVYIFATTYRKVFIVGPKVSYPNTHTTPTPTLPYPTHQPFSTLPYPNPNPPTLPSPPHPYPTLTYLIPTLLPYPYPTTTLPNLTPPTVPCPLRIQTHAHNQASRSRATLSCDSSYCPRRLQPLDSAYEAQLRN